MQYKSSRAQWFVILLILLLSSVSFGQTAKQLDQVRIKLPNGWSVTPVGENVQLGDLPLNIAVSKSKKLIAVTNNGQSIQTLQLIDAGTLKVLDTIVMRKSWLGLTFADNDKALYASGGNDNFIVKFLVKDQHLVPSDTFILGKPWPVRISIAGITVDDDRHLLYTVTKENNSLYIIDLTKRSATKQFPLGGEGYTCILSPNGKTLYTTCWGCDKIEIFDTQLQKFDGSIPVGDNPNDICISKNGMWLYVSNANDNSVSVINTKLRKVVGVLNTALYPDAPAGSTANSVALGDDDKTLFVANADNNCLAVFDVSNPQTGKGKGFIPTGWYPTCVRVIDDKVLISSGKGFSSMANPYGPNPTAEKVNYQKGDKTKPAKVQYIAGLFRGELSILKIPNGKQLSIFSHAVYKNTPYTKDKETNADGTPNNPIPMKVGDISPIKHVFYIIKENRTYDQVLGDLPQGNGDTSLVLFGEKYTPNQHALAREFVLLDNFYVDAEVSADGHNWSEGAYATDYLEKTWPTSYGDRGGDYDAEGNRDIANNKGGFIWDLCKKYGVTYRTYGEFADDYKPNLPVLKNHFCPYFTSWDERVRDTTRFYQWKREFDSLLLKNSVPQLSTIRFINDHTEGLNVGRPTPFAHVADNDLAVGLFVDYLSHSKIWNESVVFILEDDAQNGPDHVDAHRSPAYIAGGMVKKGFIDHTMYSTTSMVRTIELILGLPPMSQYDAAATPMWRCFSDSAQHPPFTFRPNQADLNEKNMKVSAWSKKSEKFDFSKEDRAPDDAFNEVIWVAVKGESSPCPPPRHAAFVKPSDKEDKD